LRFVIHCKDCKQTGDLIFGFTIELNGEKTWAIADGPSMDPLEQRKAMEDRDAASLDGSAEQCDDTWDKGNYIPIDDYGHVLTEHEAVQCLKEGLLKFFLQGKKLVGEFVLMKRDVNSWLFMKRHDEFALYTKYSLEVLAD
jgi:bifunctional non-homologous end joining protein LigD